MNELIFHCLLGDGDSDIWKIDMWIIRPDFYENIEEWENDTLIYFGKWIIPSDLLYKTVKKWGTTGSIWSRNTVFAIFIAQT